MVHVPVLLQESIHYLDPKPNELFIDCTLGGGGHTKAILDRIGPQGKILSIDLSKSAIEEFRQTAEYKKHKKQITLAHGNFSDITEIVKKHQFERADGLIADLGFSSDHLESSGRGFSFLKDEPLLMTYDENAEFSAASIINSYRAKELGDLIMRYSNERFAYVIAKNIVAARKSKRILMTSELVEVIKKSVPSRYERGRIHPATRTFLALRIEVNNEPENLKNLLENIEQIVAPRGRIVIISFQSLEDKIIKDIFRAKQKEKILTILTKKPVTPTPEEIQSNARARSAKLRAACILH